MNVLGVPILIAAFFAVVHDVNRRNRSLDPAVKFADILADGVAVVEQFAPLRAVALERGDKSGDSYLIQVDDTRVVWCNGDWPKYGADSKPEDSAPIAIAETLPWPNTQFQLTTTREHAEFLSIELSGDEMLCDHRVEWSEIRPRKLLSYMWRHNIYGSGIIILVGSIDEMLREILVARR
jgi:hypothetical protein